MEALGNLPTAATWAQSAADHALDTARSNDTRIRHLEQRVAALEQYINDMTEAISKRIAGLVG